VVRKLKNRLMNKRDNPYTPGAGRKPPILAGRDPDLENVQALIERLSAGGYERSLVYSNLRGVGKTVLLMEFDVLASGRPPFLPRLLVDSRAARRAPSGSRRRATVLAGVRVAHGRRRGAIAAPARCGVAEASLAATTHLLTLAMRTWFKAIGAVRKGHGAGSIFWELHKRLHTYRILERVQVAWKEKAPRCSAFAKPSDGLEPSTPSLPCDPNGNRWQSVAKDSACSSGLPAPGRLFLLPSVAPSFFQDLSIRYARKSTAVC
jgi:hypothetical protein